MSHFTEPDTINHLYIMGAIFVLTCGASLHWTLALVYYSILMVILIIHLQKTISLVTEFNLNDNYYENPFWIILICF